jgi:FdhE protein
MHAWDERIARARELALRYASSREVLTFYGGLAERQRSLFLDASRGGPTEGRFADSVDVAGASAAMPDLLAWIEGAGPASLARSVAAIRTETTDWRQLIRDVVTREATEPADPPGGDAMDEVRAFIVDAVLQPYAEAAASLRRDSGVTGGKSLHQARCPVCACRPSVGTLREAGHGARRALVCARCLTEWEFLRVVCPGCREERFDALPVYTADEFPHVRIEACDTCLRYLKTIDLTKDGLAVPIVDDIASVPLDLWAAEKGYRRYGVSLLRIGCS